MYVHMHIICVWFSILPITRLYGISFVRNTVGGGIDMKKSMCFVCLLTHILYNRPPCQILIGAVLSNRDVELVRYCSFPGEPLLGV